MNIPVMPVQLNSAIVLRLRATCAINPQARGTSQDVRTLSYILSEIDASAASTQR